MISSINNKKCCVPSKIVKIIAQMYINENMPVSEIAKEIGLSTRSVYRYIREANLDDLKNKQNKHKK